MKPDNVCNLTSYVINPDKWPGFDVSKEHPAFERQMVKDGVVWILVPDKNLQVKHWNGPV